MKANELRIGNWAMYSSKIQVNENKIRECVDHPDRFAPIPLTKEWLERFGFERRGEGYSSNIFYRQEDLLNWEYAVHISKETGITVSHGFYGQFSELANIGYVHQLQNLYFALTGEELNQNKEDE